MSQKESPDQVTLLAFGAHPDDIEFGCGAIIAQETQCGGSAHLVVCSRGEAGTHGTPDTRETESRRAAEILGASIEFLELGGDVHLAHAPSNTIEVARVIRRIRPQILLAPSLVENQHPDHTAMARLVRDAARVARYGGVDELRNLPAHAVGQLFYYAITVEGEPKDVPPILIDVSNEAAVKAWLGSMEAHSSQLQTRNYVELQLARARLNGVRCGSEYALMLYPNDPLVFESLMPLTSAARRF